ncbi:MAG: hypothetical protein M3Q56_09305 [Bacteroidota bacterium]|nr:hypothetical protein [Bacteroidota bacterium]
MKFYTTLFLLTGILCQLNAQNYSAKASVFLAVSIIENPPSIILRWNFDPEVTQYTVYRKLKSSKTWGSALANLPKDSITYRDKNIELGKAYEYRVSKSTTDVAGTGYLYGGIKYEPEHYKGSILLMIELKMAQKLPLEIQRLKNDLKEEGWNVLDYITADTTSVVINRNKIISLKSTNPDLRTVFIVGHVKVPYSGDLAPDGHGDHVGAWPCDGYYGELDGSWTDVAVNNIVASRTENDNIPGDGKFDASIFPSPIELEVGRVDFFNMPAFNKSDSELLKRYLDKNHEFRKGNIVANRSGIVQDNFNFRGEGFGQSGYKNFSCFFGPNQVFTGTYRDSLLKSSYLWSYGAGGGWYQGAGGISTTQNMVVDSLQGIFTFLFGSYFGDWDSQDNFLRASIASGTMLASAWAGRPVWQVHHMAMGEHIGYSAKLVQNNNTNTYFANYSAAGVHIALMGDPSLVMFPVKPPKNLVATEEKEEVLLSWEASSQATDGYYVFRKQLNNRMFELISGKIKETTFQDKCLELDGTYEYMVRAINLERNGSGSFYNLSPGIRTSITKTIPNPVVGDFRFTKDFDFIQLVQTDTNAKDFYWLVNQDTFYGTTVNTFVDCRSSTAEICLISKGTCADFTKCDTVDVICSVPDSIQFIAEEIKCFGDSGSIEVTRIFGGAKPFSILWITGDTGSTLTQIPAGDYLLEISSRLGTTKEFNISLRESPELILDSLQLKADGTGGTAGGVIAAFISGGKPPYSIRLAGGFTLNSLKAGRYTLIITDVNSCQISKEFEIKLNTAANQPLFNGLSITPQPVNDLLMLTSTELIHVDEIQIYNSEGLMLQRHKNIIPKSTISLDVSQLIPGYYQIRMIRGLKSKTQAFIKE